MASAADASGNSILLVGQWNTGASSRLVERDHAHRHVHTFFQIAHRPTGDDTTLTGSDAFTPVTDGSTAPNRGWVALSVRQLAAATRCLPLHLLALPPPAAAVR